jgi:hypothetical protein
MTEKAGLTEKKKDNYAANDVANNLELRRIIPRVLFPIRYKPSFVYATNSSLRYTELTGGTMRSKLLDRSNPPHAKKGITPKD